MSKNHSPDLLPSCCLKTSRCRPAQLTVPARARDERRIMPPMTDLTLRRATAADERVLAALAARLSAFELPSWRAPQDISDADARAMIAAVVGGEPDDEVLDRRARRRGGRVPSRPGGHRLLRAAPRARIGHRHHGGRRGQRRCAHADGAGRAMDGRARLAAADAQHVRRECAGSEVLRNRRFQVEMVKYAKRVNSNPQIPTSQGTPNRSTRQSKADDQSFGSWSWECLGIWAWSLGVDT